MDIYTISQLKRDLDGWSLNLMDAPHQLREIKERVVQECRLDSRQISALPDDCLGLWDVLKDHVKDALDDLEPPCPPKP